MHLGGRVDKEAGCAMLSQPEVRVSSRMVELVHCALHVDGGLTRLSDPSKCVRQREYTKQARLFQALIRGFVVEPASCH